MTRILILATVLGLGVLSATAISAFRTDIAEQAVDESVVSACVSIEEPGSGSEALSDCAAGQRRCPGENGHFWCCNSHECCGDEACVDCSRKPF